jgi:3-methylcrotonyl-CoA carboxylase alpha subunit
MRQRPIRRLLIANRGEIVCRIVATCRLMGIETVTVFAPDDCELPHATAGDLNCELEGATLAETYLNGNQLIAIARRAKADAIHPGYGFLSENAAFAKAVTAAGLIFVGPPADVIARMGDKAASRKLCEKIGVPVIPGYHGDKQDMGTFAREAKKIGYPVLVKASAGGGGKGMRVVEREKDLAAAVQSAGAEAQSAFGNGRLLLEKYLQQPRHIEVQVFSDTQGHHLHLFERECSIQRRHQKIIEESPAPNLPDATRKKLFQAATKISSYIGYVGAGTVEFILDRSGAFYFLEMNTRLQVEHPVTEMVTGLDLVQLQLEVAQGKKLAFSQNEVVQNGHAVEARLYAEDTERDFLPSPDTLSNFLLPHLPHLRCENGYRSGNRVSARYDPMLAKLVAWGATRNDAIATLIQALHETRIAGVTTNRAFLMRILDCAPFREGKTATDFIPHHKPLLISPELSDADMARLAAAYLLFGARAQPSAINSAEECSAWTHSRLAGFK